MLPGIPGSWAGAVGSPRETGMGGSSWKRLEEGTFRPQSYHLGSHSNTVTLHRFYILEVPIDFWGIKGEKQILLS